MDPFGTGKIVLFQVHYDKEYHVFELIPFLLTGAFAVRQSISVMHEMLLKHVYLADRAFSVL